MNIRTQEVYMTFFLPRHLRMTHTSHIPNATRAYYGTANMLPKPGWWFLMPNILAN